MFNNSIDHKTYTAICAQKTLQSNENGFFMQFVESVVQHVGDMWIRNVFGKLKSDHERIRIIYQNPTIKETVVGTLSHVQEIYRKKCAAVSQARRIEAEKVLKSGNPNKALILISQSVLRAPKTKHTLVDNGLSLALALWVRSEVLMALRRFSLALLDIQLALKEGLHNSYKAEAFGRMAVCYKAKGEEKRAHVAMDLAKKLLIDDAERVNVLEEAMKKDYNEVLEENHRVMPTIKVKHPECSNVTIKLTIKQDPQNGRYGAASTNIATGETIICEPPYSACLLPNCFGTHCHNCFDRLISPIGCPNCSNVAFCKIECRDVAINSYHKHECKFIELLIGSGMSILSHTALRMVTQNLPERMYEIVTNRSLEKVYSLCSLSDKRDAHDFLQRTLMAAFLLRCLQLSGYFGYVDNNVVPNENQLGVGELLLFHLQILQFNAHEIYETRHAKEHRFKTAKEAYVGVAIYPTVALLNHDCYPGVSRHFVGKNIVIKALRPIHSGEPIPENYGPVFTRKPLAERKRYLSGRYWFDCKCLACSQSWPTLDTGLSTLSRRVRCPTKKCMYLFTLPVSKESGKCPKCKQKVNLMENISQLQICEEKFLRGFKLMDLQEVDKGIQLLCSAIDTFYKISAPPHRDLHLAQECTRALFADSGNRYEVLPFEGGK